MEIPYNFEIKTCFQNENTYFGWSLNAWRRSPDFMDHKLEIQNPKVEESMNVKIFIF